MGFRKQLRLLIIAACVMFSYLVVAEAFLPIRATADERSVIPDVTVITETGFLSTAKYFSGVAYQFQASILLQLAGLSPEALQLLSPVVAGIAFAVFFSVGLLVYRRETDQIWWGFMIPALAVVVFPGFVSRAWESTHKAYTFVLLFLAVYLVYIGVKKRSDKRLTLLIGFFLIGVGFFNYIWGAVYAALVGLTGLTLVGDRWRSFSASLVAGITAVILPGISPLRRYHRAYFMAVKRQVDKIAPGLISPQRTTSENETGQNETLTGSKKPSDGFNETTPTGGETTTPTGGETTTPTGGETTPSTTPKLPSPGRATAEGSAAKGNGVIAQAAGQIGQWPSVEIAGIGISVWYFYSAGIGIVASITAITGLLCTYLLVGRQLSVFGQITLSILGFSTVLVAVFAVIGDIATLKRIIVLPGFFGTLYFAVFIAKQQSKPQIVQQRTPRVILTIVVLSLLLTAGLSTNRSLVDGGDSPLDIYVNQGEVAQVNWISNYGVTEGCYYVKQRVVAHYYRQQTGGRIGQLTVDPSLTNIVYQSTTRGATAIRCL